MLAHDSINLQELKNRISVPTILALFSIVPDGGSKIRCLWHNDTGQPNCHVYEDHLFCFSCQKTGDIFSVVCKLKKCRLEQAVEWLLQQHNIPVEQIIREKPVEYLGALPQEWLYYWQQQLTDEHKEYFQRRLITQETLEFYQIGYRPDRAAFTLPFWSGVPSKSDVVSLQYRDATGKQDRKYWWETGRYRPCVFNQHLINDDLVIVVFGSLDAVIGNQLGLPVVSASGLNTFANPKKAESLWLRDTLAHVKQKIVLPDATLTEFEPALKVANIIGAEMRFFPRACGAKDLNDYFILGNTVQNFYEEILEMSMKTIWNGRLFAVADIHLGITEQCLRDIAQGNAALSFREILKIAAETGYHSKCFSHALSMMADSLGPTGCNAPFTSEEWREFMNELDEAGTSYTDLRDCIAKWNNLASSRLGGF